MKSAIEKEAARYMKARNNAFMNARARDQENAQLRHNNPELYASLDKLTNDLNNWLAKINYTNPQIISDLVTISDHGQKQIFQADLKTLKDVNENINIRSRAMWDLAKNGNTPNLLRKEIMEFYTTFPSPFIPPEVVSVAQTWLADYRKKVSTGWSNANENVNMAGGRRKAKKSRVKRRKVQKKTRRVRR